MSKQKSAGSTSSNTVRLEVHDAYAIQGSLRHFRWA